MSIKGASQKFSTEELRKFYFSRATDFGAFHSHETSAVNNASVNRSAVGKTPALSPIPAASANAVASTDAAAAEETSSPTTAAVAKPTGAPVAAGSAVQAARRQQGSPVTTSGQVNTTTANANATLNESKTAGSVSNEYMVFLRQQQDILNAHQDAESTIRAALTALQQHRAEQDDVVAHAAELLRAAEGSTSWGWKSKFTKDTLRRDAALDVDFEELCRKEDVPNVAELQQQQHQLQRLKQELAAAVKQLQSAADAAAAPDADAAATSMATRLAPFGPLLDAGLRRVEVLLRDFSQSNIDATPIVRLADTLLLQLDHALGVAPLSRVLQDANDRLRVAEQRRAECLAVRERALDEGTMDVAERASFQLAELSESCTAAVQEKLRLITHVAEEHAVVETVCKSYADQFQQATAALDDETATKKRRCEEDLARLYGLKQKVADVETAAAARWEADRVASDERLASLETRRADVWTQLLALAQQLDTVESERHAELKRRVEEKVKDEGRRSEYAVFIATVAEVAEALDRTVRNMELRQQGTRFMADFVHGGFGTVQRDIAHHRAQVQAELLAAHEQHLASFRELLFVLGDLEYKKEKRVEELGAQVQTAHIQQELCNDSLNPQAKRFSDQKKDLLARRDGVEQEVRALRDRQEAAVAKFAPSEAALSDAGAMPRHPLTELEEWRLNTRARMVEFKALALGGVASAPLRAELETLSRTLDESRQLVRSVQNRTTV